jgi:hypothetical protein
VAPSLRRVTTMVPFKSAAGKPAGATKSPEAGTYPPRGPSSALRCTSVQRRCVLAHGAKVLLHPFDRFLLLPG